MNQPPKSFLDTKSIFAIVFVALCWFVWDGYMKKKYPHLYKKEQATQVNQQQSTTQSTVANTNNVNNSVENVNTSGKTVNNSQNVNVDTVAKEQIIPYQSDNLNFEISTYGMAVKNIVLNNYKDRDYQVKKIKTNFENNSFETKLMGRDEKIIFNVTKISDNRYEGTANIAGVNIVKTLEVNPADYNLKIKTRVDGIQNSPNYKGIKLYLTAEKTEDKTSIMNPMMMGQELFVSYENTDERLYGDSITEENLNLKNVNLVNLGETYFSTALVNNSNTLPTFNHFVKDNVINGQINYPYLNRENSFQEVLVTGFVGPKDTQFLKRTDEKLLAIIDYGWFDTISRWLLKLLKSINTYVGNWGFSIVIMTIIIKVLLLPFYIYSSKSMKRMQAIQPEIKKIREKFKDTPQEMNLKVMQLMRDHKANPVSGCLPMIIPIPIFFAFYRVLGQSIDLYQAPFALWIQDLSLKDPYYILPVLMSIAMFFQMKISPSAMDPMQKKVMMFMPLLFGLFMLALPSGLTLYIFVSTLFGILQHFIIMRDNSSKAPVLSKA